MPFEELEEVGLTARERKVYVSLLELGLSSVGPIIRKSGVPSSKIYETLDRLSKKGFVSSIVKEGKKHFLTAPPKAILSFLDERRRTFENVVPQLEGLQAHAKIKIEATVFEGIVGIRSVYNWLLRELNNGDVLYVLSVPRRVFELLEPYFEAWNKERIAKGIRVKIIYNPDARAWGEMRKKMKYTEVRYLPEKLATPVWTDIFKDYVIIFSVGDFPAVFLIRDANIAASYNEYFNLIWRQCEK